jgi:type IV secretory pathway TrbD component
VLGTIRTLWSSQIWNAECRIAGTPNRVDLSIFAARRTVGTFPAARGAARLAIGCVALVLMLAAEFGLMLWLRGDGIRQYLETCDPGVRNCLLRDAGGLRAYAAVGVESQTHGLNGSAVNSTDSNERGILSVGFFIPPRIQVRIRCFLICGTEVRQIADSPAAKRAVGRAHLRANFR